MSFMSRGMQHRKDNDRVRSNDVKDAIWKSPREDAANVRVFAQK
jgi:hypothetical protein